MRLVQRPLRALAKPVFDTTGRFEAITNQTVMPTLLNIIIAIYPFPASRESKPYAKVGTHLRSLVWSPDAPRTARCHHPGGDPHPVPNLVWLWLPDSLGASTGPTDKRWGQGMSYPVPWADDSVDGRHQPPWCPFGRTNRLAWSCTARPPVDPSRPV